MKVIISPPEENTRNRSILELSRILKLSTKSAMEFFNDNVDKIPTKTITLNEAEVNNLKFKGWNVVELELTDFNYVNRDEALLKAEAWVETLSEEEKRHIEVLKKSAMPMG